MSAVELYSQEWITDQIVNNPNFSMMMIDDRCRLIFVNDTYLHIMGFRREEIIGRHIDDITPLGRTPKILASGKADVGYLMRVNGVDTIAASYPIFQDGKVVGVFGTSIFLDMSQASAFGKKLSGLVGESEAFRNKSHEYHRQIVNVDNIIGNNAAFKDLKRLAMAIAKAEGTVLITGESGTGKDLFAKAVHLYSPREMGPFVRLNCAAIPENLIESELFGYDEGTFTGGIKGGKKGKFEVADRGTIFLDEIGELPLSMQSKLLNVLQEKEIEPLGSVNKRPKKVDVRVIAATNKELEDMVDKGTFRQDLYYRLNVSKLNIPPLRQRKDDLPLLTEHIINKLASRTMNQAPTVNPEVYDLFNKFDWPGNVRQLENVIERAMIRAEMDGIKELQYRHFSEMIELVSNHSGELAEDTTTDLKHYTQQAEKKLISEVLNKTNGNKAVAAQMLGIHVSALYKKMNKYNIE